MVAGGYFIANRFAVLLCSCVNCLNKTNKRRQISSGIASGILLKKRKQSNNFSAKISFLNGFKP
jgi:hypothetical protein